MSYVQVYTGEGKGKTTAALGLALRAYGAGLKVFFAQFLKKGDFSEIGVLERFDEAVDVRQYGTGDFFDEGPTDDDIKAVREGIAEIRSVLEKGDYDMVVLDEANLAIYYGIVDVDELIRIISGRHEGVEVIITGRYADEKLIEMADLVTEMKEIKHYYNHGVHARKGIEK